MSCNASGIKFNDMNLKNLRLEDTNLSGGNFICTDLESSRMRRMKATSADFTESTLKNLDW